MARTKRDGKIDSRSARLKLPARKEPYWTALAPREALGYYRPAKGGSGTWWARLYDPESKKIQKNALGTADDFAESDGALVLNFAQAQVKAREWFDDARSLISGDRIHRGPLTIKDIWKSYEEDAIRRGMKSVDQTRCTVEAHILPALGSVQVEKLTQVRIERWHSELSLTAARLRSRKGAEPVFRPEPKTDDEKRARRESANRVLAILKAMLNHAKRQRMTRVSGDAWREARPFRGTTSARQRFLSPEEAQRLVNVSPSSFRQLVQGALYSGARFGELARLGVSDFNAANGTLFIAQSKSLKSRHIVLTEEGQAFFQSMTAGRRGDEIIFLRDSYESSNWMDAKKLTRPWRKSEPSRAMDEACELAGLEPMTFHELRHTYASGLVNRGVPLAYVAAQLGHSDTRMVEKHYGHLAPSAMADAIRTLAPKLGILGEQKIVPLRIESNGCA